MMQPCAIRVTYLFSVVVMAGVGLCAQYDGDFVVVPKDWNKPAKCDITFDSQNVNITIARNVDYLFASAESIVGSVKAKNLFCRFHAVLIYAWDKDQSAFDSSALSVPYKDKISANYIKINDTAVLRKFVMARIRRARKHNCTGILWNFHHDIRRIKLDYKIDEQMILRYMKFLSGHTRYAGFKVGLQSVFVLPESKVLFDVFVTSDCFRLKKCNAFKQLSGDGKRVFNVETKENDRACEVWKENGIHGIFRSTMSGLETPKTC